MYGEKVLVFYQIFEIEIFLDLQDLRYSEFENNIFNVCSVHLRIISVLKKQIIAKILILILHICIIGDAT